MLVEQMLLLHRQDGEPVCIHGIEKSTFMITLMTHVTLISHLLS